MFIGMPFFILSLLFIIKDIEYKTIYSYFLSFLIIDIYYYYYYYYKWKIVFNGEQKEKYIKKLQKNNYTAFQNGISSFEIKEDTKKRPFLTKMMYLVGGVMLRFGFTIPVLAALSSTGTGDEGMIYFAIYLLLFFSPELMKMNARLYNYYKFIKQIEKEHDIIIYNGIKTEENKN
jgi:hypothetical protein